MRRYSASGPSLIRASAQPITAAGRALRQRLSGDEPCHRFGELAKTVDGRGRVAGNLQGVVGARQHKRLAAERYPRSLVLYRIVIGVGISGHQQRPPCAFGDHTRLHLRGPEQRSQPHRINLRANDRLRIQPGERRCAKRLRNERHPFSPRHRATDLRVNRGNQFRPEKLLAGFAPRRIVNDNRGVCSGSLKDQDRKAKHGANRPVASSRKYHHNP